MYGRALGGRPSCLERAAYLSKRGGHGGPPYGERVRSAGLLCGDIETSHLSLIADQQTALGNRGVVPGLTLDRRKLCQLGMFVRRSLNKHQLAGVGDDDQMPGCQYQLAVAVTTTLPPSLAGLHID